MSSKNKFETLKKNIQSNNVEKTLGFFKSLDDKALTIIYHELKRSQIFSVKTPDSLIKKMPFLKKLNIELNNNDFVHPIYIYLELIEKIYEAMFTTYNKFHKFYQELEKNDETKYFISYLFKYYIHLNNEFHKYIEQRSKAINENQPFDATSAIKVPNMDNHISDVDTQVEFIAEFIKLNLQFYKFISKDKSIDIISTTFNSQTLNQKLNDLYSIENLSTLDSYNVWRNGNDLIELINLYDWDIKKNITNKFITFSVIPKNKFLNEYINKEFGGYLYSGLKHSPRLLKYMNPTIKAVEQQNSYLTLMLTFRYIVETFENEYYLDQNIFDFKYKNITLKSYTLFYLIFRNYFFYFIDNNDRKHVYIVNFEFIVNQLLSHIKLFEHDLKDNYNNDDLYEFLTSCLDFFTNQGNDLFNYPFFKYNLDEYAVPDTIVNANISRIFIERFSEILPQKKLSSKGKILENYLLSNKEKLLIRGIQIQKNIELKKGNKVIGEIDLLLYDGSNIIIAELKNQQVYNNLNTRYNRKKDLKKATLQIKKARDYLYKNKKNMSSKLNIPIDKVEKIIPIVITSLDEINNVVINDTLVTNAFLVKVYFEHDHVALREYGMNTSNVIERRYYNEERIFLNEFIHFIKKNSYIKVLKFFQDKKINDKVVFKHENILFKRRMISYKEIF